MDRVTSSVFNKKVYLTIIIGISAFTLHAQAIMVPTTRTVHTPYGPAQITSWQNVGPTFYPNMNTQGLIPYVGKINLTVALKSDSVFSEKLFFNVADSVHSLILERKEKKGGDVIYLPSDTKQISQFYEGKHLIGIPADSCWLFKMREGTISTYAPFPTHNDEFFTAIQKENGPIVPFTRENLIEMVGHDPKLLKMIEKGKMNQAVWKYNGSK